MPQSFIEKLIIIGEPFWIVSGVILLSILPAWGLARRLSCDPLTRLMVSVMGSYAFIYLLEFGVYLLSAPAWIPFFLCVLASLVSTIFVLRSEKPISWRGFIPLQGVVAWVGLALWILALQFPIVVYGECCAFGDWHEHYQRSIFFLEQQPPETKFLYDHWSLAARGPLFNSVAAVFMSGFGKEFWVFQIISTVLNTFLLLPLGLLFRDMAGVRQLPALTIAAVILAIAPLAVTLELRTETKFLTTGFILGGIYLYRLGLSQNQPWLAGWSFGALAAGFLSHYLAFIYGGFFVCHFIYRVIKNRWSWKVLVFPFAGCLVFVGTWLVYLFLVFGVKETLTANSTLGGRWTEHISLQLGKPPDLRENFAGNLISTLTPYSFRREWTGVGKAPPLNLKFYQFGERFIPNGLNRGNTWFYDLFLNYGSLPGNLGFAGGAALVIAVYSFAFRKKIISVAAESKNVRAPPSSLLGWPFWLIFYLIGIPLNVAAHSFEYKFEGLTFHNLQPYVFLTAVFLFAGLKDVRLIVKKVLFYLFLAESILTVALIMQLDTRPIPIKLVSPEVVQITGELDFFPLYLHNFILKLRTEAVFLSDHYGDLAVAMSFCSAVISLSVLALGLSALSRIQNQK